MLLLLGLLRVAIVQNFMFMVGFEAVQDLGFFPYVSSSLSPLRQWSLAFCCVLRLVRRCKGT